jgi:hypothetical protein
MMNKQFSVETVACTEQQRLFEQSQQALEMWNDRRAEFCQSHLSGKEAGDELLRLQAKYARAYTVLQNHVHNCVLCQSVASIEGRGSESNSGLLSDYEMYV